jgi:hypothetical protein
MSLNPFETDVVPDPERPAAVDVPAIHKEVFDLCRKSYDRVASAGQSWSVLVFGEAGCGKTHLLARFRNWLAGELDTRPAVPAALFVAVRMQTGAGQIWRHLRRRFAEELTRRRPGGSTRLDAILAAYAPGALDDTPDLGLDLIRVLEAFAEGRERRLCRAWLAGDSIPEADLGILRLPPPSLEGLEEDLAEYDARRVILAIVRLAAPAPVVFCFDQMEALGISRQAGSYAAFTRMCAGLIDETTNVLAISTILASFLEDLKNGSLVPDYQRISRERADLQLLDWNLGSRLLEARLASAPEIEPAKRRRLEDRLRAFFQAEHGRVTPRRLLNQARAIFDEKETEKTPAPEFLKSEFERLWHESEVRGSAETAGTVLSHGLPVALQILGHPIVEKPAKDIDLAAGTGASRINVVFGNHGHMTSLATLLKRLEEQAPVCLIRDGRLPISKNARAVHQRIQEMEASGGRLVRPTGEALAALDAMRLLLSRARSGDLSHGGLPVFEETVREWLAANLPDDVRSLAEEIAGRGAGEPTLDALIELLQLRKVVPLDEAARLTSLQTEQIQQYASAHPDRVGLFGGACPVVCQAVAAQTPEEARGSR